MKVLWHDAVFAIRILRKNPGSTAVAIVALALGIGANATVFTIANAFLFQNLPFADSERVLYVSSVNNSSGTGRGESYPDFRDFQSTAKSFESMGAFTRSDVDVSDSSGLPTQYKGAYLTANTSSIIRQPPVAGRGFLPDDARPGAAPVAVLSHALWDSRYGRNLAIIGQTIRVNEVPTVVVGIMPPGIEFPAATQIWMPLVPSGDWEQRGYRRLTMFGRLSENASVASARVEMTALARRLEAQYPATNQDIGARVETYNDYFTDSDTRLVFLALLGAVGFVLLIACANVANLLLARAAGRAREISVRAALGAGQWRVIRQLLVESVMLSAAGGMLGTIVGLWGVRFFKATLIPEDTPSYMTFAPDYRVIAYLAAITVGTGILFGLAPALGLSRIDINGVLKDSGGWTGGGRRGRVSAPLVVVETALAFVLLVGAGLMVRSFLNMAHTPMGVRTDHLMSMDILLRPKNYPSEASQITFHDQLTARLESLPGVEGVAMASNLPGDGWTDFNFELENAPIADPRRLPRTGAVIVSPSYFPLMDIHPHHGRAFLDSDRTGGVPVVIVNETFARTAWPGQDALGKRLRLVQRSRGVPVSTAPQPWRTVVGIVPDIVQSDTSQGAHDPLIYLPYRQLPQRDMVIAARTLVPPETLGHAFRREVQALDADLPVTDLRTLDRILWERTRSWRVYGSMFSIFAGIALLLAAVGLYAVIAHSVSQRTQEIGIRMAMGASAQNLLGMVFAHGMRQLLVGVLLGLAGSFGLTQALRSQLVGVTPTDPVTLATVAFVLTGAGVIGCAVPALRAVKVDPMEALRHQ